MKKLKHVILSVVIFILVIITSVPNAALCKEMQLTDTKLGGFKAALKDPHPAVRRVAAYALGQMVYLSLETSLTLTINIG